MSDKNVDVDIEDALMCEVIGEVYEKLGEPTVWQDREWCDELIKQAYGIGRRVGQASAEGIRGGNEDDVAAFREAWCGPGEYRPMQEVLIATYEPASDKVDAPPMQRASGVEVYRTEYPHHAGFSYRVNTLPGEGPGKVGTGHLMRFFGGFQPGEVDLKYIVGVARAQSNGTLMEFVQEFVQEFTEQASHGNSEKE